VGWHINDRGTTLFSSGGYFNRRSPRYKRVRPTKRQSRIYERQAKNCLHGLYLQIGGGQCGFCGKFTHRHLAGFVRDARGQLVPPKQKTV
jgi:hypothetical protein